jgi:hypothetical protein
VTETDSDNLDWITWAAQVETALANLGDVRQQRLAWGSHGRIFFPDPTGLCSELLDEALFDEFLETFADELGREFCREGQELISAIARYPDSRVVNAAQVLRDREWTALCVRAATLAAELGMLLEVDELEYDKDDDTGGSDDDHSAA